MAAVAVAVLVTPGTGGPTYTPLLCPNLSVISLLLGAVPSDTPFRVLFLPTVSRPTETGTALSAEDPETDPVCEESGAPS